TRNKARYDVRYAVYQNDKNKGHNENRQQLIYRSIRRKVSVITVDNWHSNTTKQCHGHQLERNPNNAPEVVNGNIRSPARSTESQYKYSGVSQHPSVYKHQQHVGSDNGHTCQDSQSC